MDDTTKSILEFATSAHEYDVDPDTAAQILIALSLKRIADNTAGGSTFLELLSQISKSLGEIAEAKKKGQ